VDKSTSIESVYTKDLPNVVVILISGSELSNKENVKVLNPEKPDRIINKAKAPTITPKEAIIVIILMVLLPLFANKYRFAMYKGKFTVYDSNLYKLTVNK